MGWIWWTEPNSTHAFRLSVLSVVLTLASGVGGCIAYSTTGSSLMLTFGLENLVDFFSSVVVCWRFFSPAGTDAAHEALLQKREKRASVAISFILSMLGVGVIIAAVEDFTHGEETADNLRRIIIVSFFSLVVFGILSGIKFHYAKLLQSPSLQKDATCSLIGTVLSGSLFVNSLVILGESQAWWLDPTVALLCGLVALGIGLRSLYRAYVLQGIPVLSPRWWISSQGDGQDEITGRELTPEDLGDFQENELPKRNGGNEEEVEEKIV
eukprot:CAMPEP_0183306272 /NCGR_PEP_ID=MMETSP0160_2-20130417/10752_1 /TAXON_ID=2839 ORGANISM="Odontella Sinensis, Strain Grunow 1884" /NCGR_SAMPLE_ID=MMETSP0160_2 /ASSEMBLY_ACC=CAM_ASM_000250 /LENGTH=267 /DNA_ID=CAMNT_0025469615 /DNA_START=78 /DNA_END=881 /DNA_ORIENTATION=-